MPLVKSFFFFFCVFVLGEGVILNFGFFPFKIIVIIIFFFGELGAFEQSNYKILFF